MSAQSTAPLLGMGRRFAALAIDWALCLVISFAFFQANGLATLGIFAVEQAVLVGAVGSSVGHRLVGGRVIRIDGSAPGFGRAILRALLLCVVIPVVVVGDDRRSAHDTLIGTALVQLGARQSD